MKCPIDGTTLMIADRSGIEIDYCPQCRGVWLDRGELDKIIERSQVEMAPPPPPPSAAADYGDYDDGYADRAPHAGKRRKKGGFLSEVFDIFD
ncbi:zf-TFIIB domain-containing protein [Yoonia sp. SS1-5]|uniref:Zf-TFIIB domain-containing protein n=1 Tax=Yoonia rhodophyticola TaxID=3137370 RepID=A0ABZ3JCU2_9RHOB